MTGEVIKLHEAEPPPLLSLLSLSFLIFPFSSFFFFPPPLFSPFPVRPFLPEPSHFLLDPAEVFLPPQPPLAFPLRLLGQHPLDQDDEPLPFSFFSDYGY